MTAAATVSSGVRAADVKTGPSDASNEAPIPGALSLDALSRMDAHALASLYARGEPPKLSDLDGAPRGRMLAWVGPLGGPRALPVVGRLARSSLFPWGGKSFAARDDRYGRGINRVRVLGDQFPFETRFGASALDGRPCLILDYDQPENPWPIRQIHDELRDVRHGLFLGPAMWKARPAPKLILFFAIAKAIRTG